MDTWEPCVWTKGLRGLWLAWPKHGLAVEVLEECQPDNSSVTLIKKCGFSTPIVLSISLLIKGLPAAMMAVTLWR